MTKTKTAKVKMKPHKSSMGRVKLTRGGKLVRRQAGVRHLLTHRDAKMKRQHRANATTTRKGYCAMVRRAHILRNANRKPSPAPAGQDD